MVYKFLDKKSSGGAVKNEIMPNQQLAGELQKPIITKFGKRKVHSSFMENIWGTDITNMQLISKLKKRFFYFYYGLLIFIVNM